MASNHEFKNTKSAKYKAAKITMHSVYNRFSHKTTNTVEYSYVVNKQFLE